MPLNLYAPLFCQKNGFNLTIPLRLEISLAKWRLQAAAGLRKTAACLTNKSSMIP
jgi:hypothetical protein